MYSGFKRRCIKKTSTSSSWMPALIQGNANALLRPGVSIAAESSPGPAAPSPRLHRAPYPALPELPVRAPSVAPRSLLRQPPPVPGTRYPEDRGCQRLPVGVSRAAAAGAIHRRTLLCLCYCSAEVGGCGLSICLGLPLSKFWGNSS